MAAMNFNDLIGPKSRAGSLQNFVRYKPVPAAVVLEDAQALIFSQLRVREMRASTTLTLALNASSIALPTGYLDPISMQDREGWNVIPDGYVSEDQLLRMRTYDVTWTTLDSGVPTKVAVFDEAFQFDCRSDSTVSRKLDLVFFKRLALLSAVAPTNFLTTRYPHLLRVAIQAGAAKFMKDTEEFQGREAELIALIQAANAESDLGKAA